MVKRLHQRVIIASQIDSWGLLTSEKAAKLAVCGMGIGQLLISPCFGYKVLFRVYFWFCMHTYGERKSIWITKQLSHKREFNLYDGLLLS